MHDHPLCCCTCVKAILATLHMPVVSELVMAVSSVIVAVLLYRGARHSHAWHATAVMTGEVTDTARRSVFQQVMRAFIPAQCLPEIALIALLQIFWGAGKVVALCQLISDSPSAQGIAMLPSISPRTLLDFALSCYQVVLGLALLRSARWAWHGALTFFLLVVAYKVVEFSLFVASHSTQATLMLRHYNLISVLLPAALIALFEVLKYVAMLCFLLPRRVRQVFTRSAP